MNTPAFSECGGRNIESGEHCSRPRPIARNDDVIKLAHKISIGDSGKTLASSLSWNAKPIKSRMTCEMFEIRRCSKNYVICQRFVLQSERK